MRVNKALRRHELTTANAQNVEDDMRQIVGHEGTALGCAQTCYHVGMNGCIRGGKIDEKRHIKLLTLCARHIGSQVGTPQLMTIIVDLLTMVGKVEDNGITLFEEPYNVVDHEVVVARGIEIIGHTLPLCLAQV